MSFELGLRQQEGLSEFEAVNGGAVACSECA